MAAPCRHAAIGGRHPTATPAPGLRSSKATRRRAERRFPSLIAETIELDSPPRSRHTLAMRRPRLRLALAIVVALAVLARTGTAATDELYRAQASVTGQGEVERARGFAICLEAVLIKVSGDPRLASEPALDALKSEASRFVAGFTYRDRMAGIPVH